MTQEETPTAGAAATDTGGERVLKTEVVPGAGNGQGRTSSICKYAEAIIVGTERIQDAQIPTVIQILSDMDYERLRKGLAKRFRIRVSVLDGMRKREVNRSSDGAAGSALVFEEQDPWPDSVEGKVLLADLVETVTRYVHISEDSAIAVALWVVWTHLLDCFDVAPILTVTSPTKECGKTTLLHVVSRLVARPIASSNITSAALFRTIEEFRPTLLIDEADSFLSYSDELRGIINSGHFRETAFVIRVVGDDLEPRRFSTWGAKAIAAIGNLPDTIAGRSIPIRLERKTRNDHIARLTRQDLSFLFRDLRRRVVRWAADIKTFVAETEPSIPPELYNRAADNWRPLLAVAEAACSWISGESEWARKAEKAAVALSGSTIDNRDIGVQLLQDIRQLFVEGSDRIASSVLADGLGKMVDRPWSDWKHGKPISQAQLARRLSCFAIYPTDLKIDGSTVRGYYHDFFVSAWQRYGCNGPTAEANSLDDKETNGRTSVAVVLPKSNHDQTATEGNTLRDQEIELSSCSVVDRSRDGRKTL